MKWSTCYSPRRTGMGKSNVVPRTDYQRDFDRLVFASSFRRLQNKTQVFPLPGSTFVHNRLTHSLEVSCVGRSLGKLVGQHIADNDIRTGDAKSKNFYLNELDSVIASACLAHDIGNPAFGHSGEKAISNYFLENADLIIEGKRLRDYFSEKEWSDLASFEGNANALRVLTHPYRDKPTGGMRLTYSTLASILKYPCESVAVNGAFKHRKKYGFFQTEEKTFRNIAHGLGMELESDNPIVYARHPFVYLVEAADDICYRIIDMEDAHRLGIISKELTSNTFLGIIESLDRKDSDISRINQVYRDINDDNDSIAYLRAKCINALTMESVQVFIDHKDVILSGKFNDTLVDFIEDRHPTLKELIDLSVKRIYSHHSVVEIEITGYHVLSHLLGLFVPAVLRSSPIGTDRMCRKLVPYQFTEYEENDSPYIKTMSIVDFISGMTDAYATEFYRKTTGIDISKHR